MGEIDPNLGFIQPGIIFPSSDIQKIFFDSFDIVSHHTVYRAHTEFDVTTHRYICSHIHHQFFLATNL